MAVAERTPLWAYALWPFGACFLGASALRAAAYRSGALRRVTLPHPAISVGNLTFGGTGKTPVTIALAKLLIAAGERPAVLLRGYGRKSRGAARVSPESTHSDAGEEALVIARNLPGVAVAVGERREEAAALVADQATLFVLDDAYQHMGVERDLNILLVDASRPDDLHAPPVGRLREPLSALGRADLVVVTRGGAQDIPAALGGRVGGRPVLSARFAWEERLGPDGSGTISDWRSRKVLLFAGVGNPAGFLRTAEDLGLSSHDALIFPDHAEPERKRMRVILEKARRGACEAVLTTEKDAVKWLPCWDAPVPLLYCRLETRLEDPEGHLARALSGLRRHSP